MDLLSVALAQHVGKELTLDVARAIWRAAQPFGPLKLDDWVPREMEDGTIVRPVYLDDRFPELEEHRLRYLDERHPDEPVHVQWQRIRELERQGCYVIVVAERGRELLGSLWLFLTPSLNHGRLQVTDDLIFVMPQARGSMVALTMCRYAEKNLFHVGACSCMLRLATGNGAGRLANYLGYKKQAEVFTKSHFGADFQDAPTRHKGGEHG